MNGSRHSAARTLFTVGFCALVLASTTGCVGGLVANLIHAAKGNKVPAEYPGLKEKRVAIVCTSESEAFGPSPIAPQIAQQVAKLLSINVKDVEIVDNQEVDDWMDRNDWDGLEYVKIGKSVNADMVVAIEINGFSLSDGKTMYKGRADVSLTVYDVATGDVVFSRTPPQIQYPKNAVFHTADMSKREFRRRFVGILAQRIARHFYPYNFEEDFAQDKTIISG